MRAKDGESEATRMGCTYADRYYAGEFNVSEEEAKEIYICKTAVYHSEHIPECPFDFTPDCLYDMHKADNYKDGVVDGLLGNKAKTCKLILVELSPNKRGYECSNCQGIIRGDISFMDFCPRCGVRVV